nr:ATP phosphoribosyltransferase regulatory subunit [Rickettsiaceae bacterium]
MKLQPVRGMKDLPPSDSLIHEHIINTAKKVAALYDFSPMSVPILEHTDVFARTLGESSDVVSKEMYSFLDKSDDSLTLRPEFTAGIMRAFISGGMHHMVPLKLFSHGPLFRYDRPQAGRYRQFHQINYEFLGADGIYTDAEVLGLARDTFAALGIDRDISLELNSLGCKESRLRYQDMLVEYFTKYE